MVEEFKSIEELFERVKPALSTKVFEGRELGFSNIKEMDIWNYLAKNKWKKSNNLMLSDIVNDIFNLDLNRL